MCGIAGYNVSQEFAKKYIGTNEKQYALIREAWLHNVHRGSDAAGFLGRLVGEDKFRSFKIDKSADDILKKDLDSPDKVELYSTLAAHTRAATNGDPKYSRNNHPVYDNGVWVTHNGTIQNFKSILGSKEQDIVDSIAISTVLGQADPRDMESIVTAIDYLWGSMAIHAVWEKHPGLSLLAKSWTSPMIMAIHAAGAVFYGSEVESVYGMIKAIGLDPVDEGWDWRAMDNDTGIVVENGRPIAWSNWSSLSTTGNRSRFNIHRWLPGTEDSPDTLVYTSTLANEYAQEEYRSVYKKSPEDVGGELVASHGMPVDESFKLPAASDAVWYAVLTEADYVIEQHNLLHAFFGEVELVLSKTGRVVKDVFNHAKFDPSKRWSIYDTQPKVSELASHRLDWKAFVHKHTTYVPKPTEPSHYKYEKMVPIPFTGRPKAKTTTNGGNPSSGEDTSKRTATYKMFAGEFAISDLGLNVQRSFLEVEDMSDTIDWQSLIFHTGDNDLLFLHNELCPVHKCILSTHINPYSCRYTMMAYALVFASVGANLDLMSMLDQDIKIATVASADTAICEETEHEWVPSSLFRFKGVRYYWDIVEHAWCAQCLSSKKVDQLPEWMLKLGLPYEIVSIWIDDNPYYQAARDLTEEYFGLAKAET